MQSRFSAFYRPSTTHFIPLFAHPLPLSIFNPVSMMRAFYLRDFPRARLSQTHRMDSKKKEKRGRGKIEENDICLSPLSSRPNFSRSFGTNAGHAFALISTRICRRNLGWSKKAFVFQSRFPTLRKYLATKLIATSKRGNESRQKRRKREIKREPIACESWRRKGRGGVEKKNK